MCTSVTEALSLYRLDDCTKIFLCHFLGTHRRFELWNLVVLTVERVRGEKFYFSPERVMTERPALSCAY